LPSASYPPWLRYADNLAYACRDVTEGRQDLDLARHTLGQAGFLLKEEDDPPADLRRGDEAQLLGFTLRHDRGRLARGLGNDAWEGLAPGPRRRRAGGVVDARSGSWLKGRGTDGVEVRCRGKKGVLFGMGCGSTGHGGPRTSTL
jgi:hypothetical protein